MAPQIELKTTYVASKVVQPYFSGGPGNVGIDSSGRLLATVCEDEVVVTDIKTGVEVARIEGDGEELTTLALSPSGNYLITCSRSYMLNIYTLSPTFPVDEEEEEGSSLTVEVERTRQVKQTAPAMVATIDPTDTLVAIGGSDGLVKVWDIRRGFITHNLRGHGGLVSALAFWMDDLTKSVNFNEMEGKGSSKKKSGKERKSAPLGRVRLATGGDDTTVRIWDLENHGRLVKTLESHTSVVRGLDWNADGTRLLSGSRDGTMCLLDVASWKFVITAAGEEVEAVGFIAPGIFTRSEGGGTDRLVFCAGRQDRVRVWDLVEGAEITAENGDGGKEEEEEEEKGVIQIVYHKNLGSLWAVHRDFTITEHALRLPSPPTETLPVVNRITANFDEIIDCRYLPPNSKRLAIATNSEDIRIVSTESFHDLALLQGHTETVLTLDVDWSGHWLATAGKDNTARLWKLTTNECVAVFSGHAESIAALALPRIVPQPDSHAATDPLGHPPKFMITGGADQTVKKWDTATRRAIYTRRAHDKDINGIALSPDDKTFASASQDRTIKIWSVETGETIGVLRGHRRAVWSVQFAPTSVNPSIVGGAGTAGSMVVSGSTDKTLKLWSLTDYSCLRTFEGHTNSLQRALFFNAGTQLASAGNDGLVKLWDIKSGECVASLDNHSTRIWALDTTDDGAQLLSADAAGIITLWTDTTAATVAEQDAKEAELVEQEQQLQNFIACEDYRSAIVLALTLNHPGRLLHLLTAVTTSATRSDPTSLTGSAAVDTVLRELDDVQLATLLCRIRDWNTNARTATVAQRVLHAVVKQYPAERLGRLRGVDGGVWAALATWTERHRGRTDELWGESWCLEWVLAGMEQLDVMEEEEEEGAMIEDGKVGLLEEGTEAMEIEVVS